MPFDKYGLDSWLAFHIQSTEYLSISCGFLSRNTVLRYLSTTPVTHSTRGNYEHPPEGEHGCTILLSQARSVQMRLFFEEKWTRLSLPQCRIIKGLQKMSIAFLRSVAGLSCRADSVSSSAAKETNDIKVQKRCNSQL